METIQMGCTVARHRMIGVTAVVNARAGRQDLNEVVLDETEMRRDAQKIRDRVASRVRFYQFNSKFFRRHAARFAHLVSERDE